VAFRIRMGVPEMEAYWHDISTRKLAGKLDRDEEKFFKKLARRWVSSVRIRAIQVLSRMKLTI